ncbi:hypothetical protein [Phytohabitans aurantiacus]|jgi:hypothetical protein|uniref:Uncharacterized protein n=1 Tax=Phytohabitans aurantiacus TaxID=3016789 RepID=A0ABQ5QVA7_9ACTN|nr:hypothetical protein [Phytohabitans aurantiacus]GLH98192.1 hypothetical protein Pa4123_34670 [Phytohabitans aurantiacus]
MTDQRTSTRRRRTWVAALAAALLGATLVAVVTPAAHAVSGLNLVNTESPQTGSQNTKTAVATCTGNDKLFGTGFDVINGLGKVAVNAVRPSADLKSLTVVASETDAGITTSWRLAAHAICGPPVANMRPEVETEPSGPGAEKTGETDCGNNGQVYGGGFEFNGGLGEVLLTRMFITLGFSGSVSLRANVDDDLSRSWSVTTYAICGQNSAGLFRNFTQNPVSDSNSPKDETATCGNDNLNDIHGTGVQLPAQPVNQSSDIVIEKMKLTAALATVELRARENDSTSANWSVQGHVICGPH